MKDISKDIISKIKEKKIKPIPKWHFLMKNWIIWALFVISIIVGGLSFGGILFQVTTNEWDIARRMTKSIFYFIMISLPYFWVLLMIGFSFLAYHYLRKTKKGYKYSVLIINLISISASLILGILLFFSGISLHLNNLFRDRVPMYDRMMDMHHELLMDEDNGVVIGGIVSIFDEEIEIRDLKRKIWRVDVSEAESRYLEKAQVGDKVIVIGEIAEDFIEAEIIRSADRRNGREMPFLMHFGEDEMMPPPPLKGSMRGRNKIPPELLLHNF